MATALVSTGLAVNGYAATGGLERRPGELVRVPVGTPRAFAVTTDAARD